MRGVEVLIVLQAGEQIKTRGIRDLIFRFKDGRIWAYTKTQNLPLRDGGNLAVLGWQEYALPVSHLFQFEWVTVPENERK